MGRRRQAVTIRHVAADAGVSLQTVSRVINNEPNVRPAMKDKVQASIDKLGYVPSLAAQRMSGSRSYLILAINDRERTIADWQARRGTDWVDQMLLGGMLACQRHGYRMMLELIDTHSDHVERELGAALAALQPDGVVLTPPHSDNALIVGLLADRKIPIVRIGGSAKGFGYGIRISMDDERAARLATERLIAAGHAQIALIAGLEEYALSGWRIDGWQAAMAAGGLPCEGLCARGDFSYESGIEATRRLLDRPSPPTAIIAGNDQMALAVLEVARERGLRIPQDLSVVSFDNTPSVRFGPTPLTAIDQPIAATAGKAAELLIAAKGGQDLPGEAVVVPARLVERDSVAPPPPPSS